MFCSQCGTEAAPEDRFCRSCGRELAVPTVNEPIPEGGRPGPAWSGQSRVTPPSIGGTQVEALVDAYGFPIAAHIGRRISAFLIDYVVMSISAFVALVIVVGVYEGTQTVPFEELTETEQTQLSYLGLAIWSLPFFLGTWVLNATGGSLGKRILGLRIVRADLSSPGWAVGLGRTAAAWLSWPLFGLGFLWATWDDRGQTFHDKLAGTYVVRHRPELAMRQMAVSSSDVNPPRPGSLH